MESGSHSVDGYTGNGLDALTLLLNVPCGLWVDGQENIIIADSYNNRIRKSIKVTNKPKFIYGKAQSVNVCHLVTLQVDSLLSITDIDSPQTQTWTVLTPPVHGTLFGFPATATSIGMHSVAMPTTTSYIPATSYTGQDSFRIRVTDGVFSDTTTVYVYLQSAFTGGIGGADNICSGHSTTLTGCAPTGLWSVSNTHASIGATSGIISGVTSGVDTITFYVGGSCPTTATKVFTVNAIPSAGIIIAPDSICPGATAILTETVPGGRWSVGSSYAMIDSITGSMTAFISGSELVNYTVSIAGCSASAFSMVSIRGPSPLLAGVISGPDSVCLWSSITLTNTAGGGVWATRNYNTAIGSVSGVATGVNVGTDTVEYVVTPSPGCHTSSWFVVSILMLPDPGTITGPDVVCTGAIITLVDAITGGAWSTNNTDAAISSSGNVTGMIAGIDTIVYTVNNGYCTAYTQKVVTVNPLPFAGTITGADSVCKGSSIALVNMAPGGVWSAGNSNATVSSSGVVTGTLFGPDTIKYAVMKMCGTAQTNHNVVVYNCDNTNITLLSSVQVIKVFPNPTSGLLFAEWTGLPPENVDVTLADVTGRIIVKSEFDGSNRTDKVQIDLSGINDGIYFLSLTSGSTHFISKVIIQK